VRLIAPQHVENPAKQLGIHPQMPPKDAQQPVMSCDLQLDFSSTRRSRDEDVCRVLLAQILR
jgi:hypothetical protein